MAVNITEGTAVAAVGPFSTTGTLFVAYFSGTTGPGPTTAPAELNGIADYETAVGVRATTGATAGWDYCDAAFRAGVSQIYLIAYTTAGATALAAALALIDFDLGPGQVVCVGDTNAAAIYEALCTHADANDRYPIYDVKASDNTETLLATSAALLGAKGASLSNPGLGAMYGPWLNAPAPAGVIGGSARTIPASAAVAATMVAVDKAGNPGAAPGGRSFPVPYFTGPIFQLKSTEVTTLLAGGAETSSMNPIITKYSLLEIYGDQTAIGTNPATPFGQVGAGRAKMWLKSNLYIIGENYYLKTIDGQGKLVASFGADIRAVCAQLYGADALYGDTASDAFNVNVGVSINNDDTAATGTLSAVVQARFSQSVDTTDILLISVPVAGTIVS